MFDYLATAFTRKRRSDDTPKPTLDSVIDDNIQATRDLVDTLTRCDNTITQNHRDALREGEESCEYDSPTLPRRRATDRW